MSPASINITVLASAESDRVAAEALSKQLGFAMMGVGANPAHCDNGGLILQVSQDSLALRRAGDGQSGPVRVDFGAASMRHRRRGGQNELLGRAIGVGKKSELRVLDATAGLGRDGFVLADLGAEVILCERHPVIASLLAWGLRAAQGDDDPWLRSVAARVELHELDARSLDVAIASAVDVIYLDPMFPSRRKSAAVKKEMVLFQTLLESDDANDSVELLDWALSQNVARVVVKRPAKAPQLGPRAPSHGISGKAVRFDVYVLKKLV